MVSYGLNMATKITHEQIDKVLQLIEGGESERKACKQVGVNRATFRNAALKDAADSQYARALEGLAADQIEKMEQTIEDMRAKTVDSQMARVEIDARKWFASKLLPKRYGDKLDLDANISGNLTIQTVDYKDADNNDSV